MKARASLSGESLDDWSERNSALLTPEQRALFEYAHQGMPPGAVTPDQALSGLIASLNVLLELRVDAETPVSYTHLTLPTNREV